MGKKKARKGSSGKENEESGSSTPDGIDFSSDVSLEVIFECFNQNINGNVMVYVGRRLLYGLRNGTCRAEERRREGEEAAEEEEGEKRQG